MVAEEVVDDLLKEAGSSGNVVQTAEASPVVGPFTTGEIDGLVTGDVRPGGVAESDGNLVVAGQVQGTESRRCCVRAGGSAVLHGTACHARLAGGRIVLHEGLDSCLVTAGREVDVSGDVTATRIQLGDYQGLEPRLADVLSRMAAAEELKGELEGRRRLKSRQIMKINASAPVGFKLALGSLMTTGNGQLEISLQPLYAVLGHDRAGERDGAARDLFNRVAIARTRWNSSLSSFRSFTNTDCRLRLLAT